MLNTKGPAPGLLNHPDHVIRIFASDYRWTARIGNTVLAASSLALKLEESGYEPVIYFPPEDIAVERLEPINRRTTCPFKGQANYFINTDSETESPIGWTYAAVYDEVSAIAGYTAFYENNVDLSKSTLLQNG
jgi:uncharacterized protein (DUF427 family)